MVVRSRCCNAPVRLWMEQTRSVQHRLIEKNGEIKAGSVVSTGKFEYSDAVEYAVCSGCGDGIGSLQDGDETINRLRIGPQTEGK